MRKLVVELELLILRHMMLLWNVITGAPYSLVSLAVGGGGEDWWGHWHPSMDNGTPPLGVTSLPGKRPITVIANLKGTRSIHSCIRHGQKSAQCKWLQDDIVISAGGCNLWRNWLMCKDSWIQLHDSTSNRYLPFLEPWTIKLDCWKCNSAEVESFICNLAGLQHH